jgi:SAM-dependent MidA family methyltransferase
VNPKPIVELPAPDTASAEHSRQVAAHIAALIEDGGGSISFAEYMSAALYAPGLGYYSAGTEKFGEAGDFVTAPELSPLFGHVIARQVAPVIAATGGDVFEPGAGSGALAASVLARLMELDALPERYLMLEVSADLAARQAATLEALVPDVAGRVCWVDAIPDRFDGVVIANEVVDAIPVERFRIDGGEVMQARVVNAHDGFDWRFEKAPAVVERAVRDVEHSIGQPLPEGYASEVAPAGQRWVTEVCQAIGHGVVLLIDYGVARREYYAPDRDAGWLRCHFRHRAHSDPLILPGIQDITSWVDFTAIAEAGSAAGMGVIGYTTQAGFLLHGGLDIELAAFTELPIDEQVALSARVKQLTLPAEMGENFKCIGLGRGESTTLPALCAADMAHLL